MSERGKRVVRVLFDRERDADVVESIERQGSITGYLRMLVRRDIHDERIDYAAMKAAELQAENDKLRELVQDLYMALWTCNQHTCKHGNDGCYTEDGNSGGRCTLHDRMYELGVEV